MSMLPRMKPTTFYDLVIEVAIVRPGPIQGDMVHPYLRRREGREPVSYPTQALKNVLGKTLGVPLFQEQAMRVAIECAGFSPGEADQLRRAMATFKHTGTISSFQTKLVEGMAANGYQRDFAEAIFRQLEGFGSYGFPESHAASFALIAYASSWLKCHHPDVFCAALLNAQPMGFYAPAQIVRDARAHGVEVRPVCVNRSRWDCTLEPVRGGFAVRLGLRMVAGLHNAAAAVLLAARGERDFISIEEAWRRAGINQAALVALAEADVFLPAFGLARREALWAIKALPAAPLPLFAAAESEGEEPGVALRAMPESGEVVADYAHLGLSLRRHPLSFLRASLGQRGLLTCAEANIARDGRRLSTAGLVLMRQRPGSAKGVMFITIEDETGIANLVVWQSVGQTYRQVVLGARLLGVRGRLQREGDVVHLVAEELTDFSPLLAELSETESDFPLPHGRGDEFHHGIPGPDPRSLIGVKSRDFR
jgi:error-prone DNA polymerase